MNMRVPEMVAPLVDAADIRSELAALQARIDVLQVHVGHSIAANPALLGRGWVVEMASVVAQEFGLPLDDLLGICRKPSSTKPRQLWAWLIRNSAPLSYTQVARMTGYLDHTSVMWACRRIEGYRERDSYFRMVSDQLLGIAKTTREDALKASRARAAEMRGQAEAVPS